VHIFTLRGLLTWLSRLHHLEGKGSIGYHSSLVVRDDIGVRDDVGRGDGFRLPCPSYADGSAFVSLMSSGDSEAGSVGANARAGASREKGFGNALLWLCRGYLESNSRTMSFPAHRGPLPSELRTVAAFRPPAAPA
jgi:hypothetical protein